MSKLFFDHLVIREEVEIELSHFSLAPEEKDELIDIIDRTLINHVLNIILNHLPKDRHSEFISRFHATPHDVQLLDYLKTHAHPDIEGEIKKQAEKIKKEILSELKKSVHKR